MTHANDDTKMHRDLVIAGGAYVGLLLAIAVKQALPQFNITVIDGAPLDSWQKDPRASAIAAAAIRMLEALECWQPVLPHAQAIHEMIVTDSRKSDPVRPVFLRFDGDVGPNEPFAYMVENKDLTKVLRQRDGALGIEIRDATMVLGYQEQPGHVDIALSDDTHYQAQLLVAADGVNSKLRDLAGIKTVYLPYDQMGIVCTVEHERPHHGRAEEHFLPAGPFAILPLKGNRSSLVWNEDQKEANRLLNADNLIFKNELEMRFGHHLGAILSISDKRAFPFGLRLARAFVKPRFALAGDAAHGIHPISGQGLNLGFRDVAALAEIIVDQARLGFDIGALSALEDYEKWRRFETVRMGITTDVLNRLFSNDNTVLRALRDSGLGVVDRLPKLKQYFIKEAAGLVKGSPKLLKGEPL